MALSEGHASREASVWRLEKGEATCGPAARGNNLKEREGRFGGLWEPSGSGEGRALYVLDSFRKSLGDCVLGRIHSLRATNR